MIAVLMLGVAGVSCSITSDEAIPAPDPPAKRAIIEPSTSLASQSERGSIGAEALRAEVLGAVATPTATPDPEPTPTLTASRVVVHAEGDWVIDGAEIVTVHDGPAGRPIGAVAVGVVVSATGAGRVLGPHTWLEVELPDGVQGYVKSSELRIGKRPDDADPPSMLGAPAPTTTAPTTTAASTPTTGSVAPDVTTFVLDGWDPARPVYEVEAGRSKIWLIVDQELIPYSEVPEGHRVLVTSGKGRIVNSMRLAKIRGGEVDAWIDVRTLRPSS